MTFRELRNTLRDGGIADADFEAGLLFRKYAGVSAATLPLNPVCESRELQKAIERRLAHEPIQYIIGECEFYREKYFLTSDCLIPRADTEIIVEYAIRNLPRGAYFADLCTGSGCIAISVLASRPDCRAIACDISAGAVETARKNAERNGVAERIEIVELDVLTSLIYGELDAVISNPPYIRSDVIPTLSREVLREPIRALDGGDDGMIFYRKIVESYKDRIKKNGFLLFETGYDQRDEITDIANKNALSCECLSDYAGNHRGAVLRH